MAKKQKYYVVWKGIQTGIFETWEECQKQINGVEGAKYKSFENKTEAQFAFKEKAEKHLYNNTKNKTKTNNTILNIGTPIMDSIATDAACSGNPGKMEYQGVSTKTKKQLFHYYHPKGTNNIGEFLGLVHGLSYLKKHNLDIPLYTDSVNAIKWVKGKKCKTKLERNQQTEDLFQYIERAEKWLKENTYTTEILKWHTDTWGEIPADFGRK
ncbi:MAG: ribonuclease H family protein [Bacteroidales bacterium]|jgi:ribonuclease HI|nr:ribonuclease H family protein [Bacteroidales bacterium]MDD4829732.1 ribonuclease H family protein [Bacteroidales bacterium]